MKNRKKWVVVIISVLACFGGLGAGAPVEFVIQKTATPITATVMINQNSQKYSELKTQ